MSLAKSLDGHSPQIPTYAIHQHVPQGFARGWCARKQEASFPTAPCNPFKHHLLERSLCKRKLKSEVNPPSAWLCLGAGVAGEGTLCRSTSSSREPAQLWKTLLTSSREEESKISVLQSPLCRKRQTSRDGAREVWCGGRHAPIAGAAHPWHRQLVQGRGALVGAGRGGCSWSTPLLPPATRFKPQLLHIPRSCFTSTRGCVGADDALYLRGYISR